jgi:hypothetical protein
MQVEKTKKNVKFISILDPSTKEKIINLTNPPQGTTNCILWESGVSDKYPSGGWGVTLKQMPKSCDKKHPGQHVWKCSWFFNSATNEFETVNNSDSLVKPIVGEGKYKNFNN